MRTPGFKFMIIGCAILISILVPAGHGYAAARSWSPFSQFTTDTDGDGISDWKEINLYGTSSTNKDTDGDGVSDLQELLTGRDPNIPYDQAQLPKHIYISLKYQELRYYTGKYLMDDFLISSGVPGKDTPTGEFKVLAKVPTVLFQGPGYYFPNTKWNLRFKPGYYIHGAYWHSNFGNKMSHGCVNVSYTDMPPLYGWADVGTQISILSGDFPANLTMNLPSGTLLRDINTIYLIFNGNKYGIPSMAVFNSLGYSLTNVRKGSSAGIPAGYVLNSGVMPPT